MIVFILVNHTPPGEKSNFVAFHLDIQVLPNTFLGVSTRRVNDSIHATFWVRFLVLVAYSKTCVKRPLKKRQNKDLYDK